MVQPVRRNTAGFWVCWCHRVVVLWSEEGATGSDEALVHLFYFWIYKAWDSFAVFTLAYSTLYPYFRALAKHFGNIRLAEPNRFYFASSIFDLCFSYRYSGFPSFPRFGMSDFAKHYCFFSSNQILNRFYFIWRFVAYWKIA